jgi:hypothetical protein
VDRCRHRLDQTGVREDRVLLVEPFERPGGVDDVDGECPPRLWIVPAGEIRQHVGHPRDCATGQREGARQLNRIADAPEIRPRHDRWVARFHHEPRAATEQLRRLDDPSRIERCAHQSFALQEFRQASRRRRYGSACTSVA